MDSECATDEITEVFLWTEGSVLRRPSSPAGPAFTYETEVAKACELK